MLQIIGGTLWVKYGVKVSACIWLLEWFGVDNAEKGFIMKSRHYFSTRERHFLYILIKYVLPRQEIFHKLHLQNNVKFIWS